MCVQYQIKLPITEQQFYECYLNFNGGLENQTKFYGDMVFSWKSQTKFEFKHNAYYLSNTRPAYFYKAKMLTNFEARIRINENEQLINIEICLKQFVIFFIICFMILITFLGIRSILNETYDGLIFALFSMVMIFITLRKERSAFIKFTTSFIESQIK